MPDTRDNTHTPITEIHLSHCACEECDAGLISVPLNLASSEDLGRVILDYQVSNFTELTDSGLRRFALERVREARDQAPHLPGNTCAAWYPMGHNFYMTSSKSFICDCGLKYHEVTT